MFEIRSFIILTTISLSLYTTLNSQLPFNDITRKIEYEEIINYESFDKQNLFENAFEWAQISDFAISYIDSVNHNKIICEKIFELKYESKGLLATVGSREYGIQYSLILDFKDGKMRCRATNINFLKYEDPSMTGINWGYGITTTKIREGEIVTNDAEKFYPIGKNDKKYHEMFTYFFDNIDNEILNTINYLSTYISDSNNNW